jgi:putative flippase GtrA
MSPLLEKFFRFVAVGLACAILFFAINYSLKIVFNFGQFISLAATYIICFWIGYISQRQFAFRANTLHRRSLPRYLMLHFFGMLFVYYFTQWIQLSFDLGSMSSSLVATGLAGLASFIVSLTWVFRSPDTPLGAETRK